MLGALGVGFESVVKFDDQVEEQRQVDEISYGENKLLHGVSFED